MREPIRIFSGYDPRIPAGFHVFNHSVNRLSSSPVQIAPLIQHQLRCAGAYTRSEDEKASTPFSLTRFLVPYLCEYRGWALFADGSDMLVTDDIYDLWQMRDDAYAVMCVKHDYTPSSGKKFFGHDQYTYPRKNWSSLMLFNCSKCKGLTREAVNTFQPSWLHQMKWTDDAAIGDLPPGWNYLAGEQTLSVDTPQLIHYTNGLPGVPGAPQTSADKHWKAVYREVMDMPDIGWWVDHYKASG